MKKYPLGILGCAVGICLLACSLLTPKIILIFGVFSFSAAVLWLIFAKKESKSISLIFLAAFVSFLGFSLYTQFIYTPIADYAETYSQNSGGKTAEISGRILEIRKTSGGKFAYTIEANEPLRAKILLYSDVEFEAREYDSIDIGAQIYREDGGYFSRPFGDGIFLYALNPRYNPARIEKYSGRSPLAFIARLRTPIEEAQEAANPRAAAILKGITLGNTSEIEYQDSQSLSRAGIWHVVSVSGFHLAVIVGVLLAIGKLLRVKNRFVYPVSILFVLAFVVLTGAGPAIVRSAVMIILMLLGRLIRREASPLNSLGAALLIVLLPNPYAIFSPCLLLSFSSTLGILVLAAPLNRAITGRRRLKGKITEIIVSGCCVSTAALVFSAPFAAAMFSEFPLYFALGNLLTELFTEALLIMGFLLPAVSGAPVVADVLVLLCEFCAEAVYFICGIIERLPFAHLPLGSDFILPLVLMSFGVLGAAAALARDKRFLRTTSLCCAVVFMVATLGGVALGGVALGGVALGGVALGGAAKPPQTEIDVLSGVVLVKTADATIALAAGWNECSARAAVRELKLCGRERIDAMVLLNASEGSLFLLENFEVNTVLMPYGVNYSYAYARRQNEAFFALNETENFALKINSTSVEVLDLGFWNAVRVSYGEETIVYAENSYALKLACDIEQPTAAILNAPQLKTPLEKIGAREIILARRPLEIGLAEEKQGGYIFAYRAESARILLDRHTPRE